MTNSGDDEMRDEYRREDLGKGVRGMHFEKYRASVAAGGGPAVERMGKIEDLDRSFDIAYWQRQGPQAIFAAAHEMVVEAYRLRGVPLDDTIRRYVEHLGKFPG